MLKLWFPVKPFVVTQAWGIKNPSYKQFGFSEHNGVDVKEGTDRTIYSPTLLKVVETGYNDGAGNFVRLFSPNKVQIGDQFCYLGVMFMHLEKIQCKKGQVLDVGDIIGISDNTGFSTGPHIHMTFRRYSKPIWNIDYQLDSRKEADRTFDPTPFWNGYYAQDKGKLINILSAIVKLLRPH